LLCFFNHVEFLAGVDDLYETVRAGSSLPTCLVFVAGEDEAPVEDDHYDSAAGALAGEAFRVAGEPGACGAGSEGSEGISGEGDRVDDHSEGRHLEGDGSVVVADESGDDCDAEDKGLGVAHTDCESFAPEPERGQSRLGHGEWSLL
jgi:hypothetical protein